jgi:hypothetical protein
VPSAASISVQNSLTISPVAPSSGVKTTAITSKVQEAGSP